MEKHRNIEFNQERIHAEQALQKSEKKQTRQRRFLETLLNHAQACIAVQKGPELRFTLVNPAYQALLPGVEMIGRTYREVFPKAGEAGMDSIRATWTMSPHPMALGC